MSGMLIGEKLFTLLFAAFGGYVLWQSYIYGFLSSTITGPGFFPGIAGLIILLSAGLTLYPKRKVAPEKPVAEKIDLGTAASGRKVEVVRVALIVLLTAIFILACPYTGMVALTPFYLFACFLVLTPDYSLKRLMYGGLTSALFTLVAYSIFVSALGVPVPRGMIFGG
jgi:hypothetical protein